MTDDRVTEIGGLSGPLRLLNFSLDESYDIGIYWDILGISPIYMIHPQYTHFGHIFGDLFFVRTPKPTLKASWSWGWWNRRTRIFDGQENVTTVVTFSKRRGSMGVSKTRKIGFAKLALDHLGWEREKNHHLSFTDKLPMITKESFISQFKWVEASLFFIVTTIQSSRIKARGRAEINTCGSQGNGRVELRERDRVALVPLPDIGLQNGDRIFLRLAHSMGLGWY